MNVMTRWFAGFVLILTLPGPSQAVAQPLAKDDSALAGRLYVQFDDAGVSPAGGRIGIDAFDRKASQYSVTVIEKAFPSLDVIAQHRPLSAAAQALRRVYVVSYTSPAAPKGSSKFNLPHRIYRVCNVSFCLTLLVLFAILFLVVAV